jgi:hypothetical protein
VIVSCAHRRRPVIAASARLHPIVQQRHRRSKVFGVRCMSPRVAGVLLREQRGRRDSTIRNRSSWGSDATQFGERDAEPRRSDSGEGRWLAEGEFRDRHRGSLIHGAMTHAAAPLVAALQQRERERARDSVNRSRRCSSSGRDRVTELMRLWYYLTPRRQSHADGQPRSASRGVSRELPAPKPSPHHDAPRMR